MCRHLIAVLLFLLAAPAWAQEAPQPWREKLYNPAPQAGDLVLPMPCGGAMAFRRVEVPSDGWLGDRKVVIGECPSPEDAMTVASQRVARGDVRIGSDDTLRFRPRIMIIQDSDKDLVLAGAVRAGIVLWQQPVASDAEARRVVTEASRLRGAAFAAPGRGDAASARDLRFRASLLEARLVDPFWRETAAELLRLPQAA